METEKMNSILVPTDFSSVCMNALTHGVEMAAFLGFRLTLLHIINSDTPDLLNKKDAGEKDVHDRMLKIASEIKEKYDFSIDIMHREGSIFSTIGEIAGELDAKLIILGTHGKVGLRQYITGSYALKVILSSYAPVMVIQKGSPFNNSYKNIVLPVSSSSEVRQKVAWAKMIARKFKSTIHLFQMQESLTEVRTKMNVIMTQIISEFNADNIPCIAVDAPKSGNFGKNVLDYAENINADMIMIMTNPEAMNFIIGPYDEQMIFNAHQIPVMCVNPRELRTFHWFGA